MTSELLDRFVHQARRTPDRRAVLALGSGDTFTFGDLQAMAASLERALDGLRLPPGVPVVSAIGNRVEFVAALIACLASSRPLMPADPGTTTEAAIALGRAWGAGAVIAHEGDAAPPADARFNDALGVWRLPPPHDAHDAAVMKLTSGSTGTPKAVLSSAANLAADVDHIVTAMGIGPSDVQIGYIPLSHAYGFGNLVTALLWQGTAIAVREAFTPHLLPADVRASGARVMPGVPFMFDKLREVLPGRGIPAPLSSFMSAGAPLMPEAVAAFRARFGHKIHSFYGTSESGGIAYDASDEIDDRVTVGTGMPGVTITFRDVEGLDRADGRRVHVAGPAVARAYATLGDRIDEGFDDAGFLTGDLGYMDARGRVVLTGRLSSFVNVAGRKVQPEEVARRLRAMPELADASVVGLPCPLRGERLVAVIVPRGEAPAPLAMMQFCAAALPAFKVPRDFVVAGALPVDVRGKPDRRALMALAAGRVGQSA
jgi:long-chain acyl-CoA synthetase